MTNPLLIDVPERLQTARLLLRVSQAGDGAVVCEAVRESLDRLRPWMPWAQTAPEPEQQEQHQRRSRAAFLLRDDLTWLMFERLGDGEGLFVGGVGLHRIDWDVPRFEVGYWVRTGFEGQGLVAEAVRALTRLAFDRLAAARVEIRMDGTNLASRRVAERCGYTLEGVLRHNGLTPAGALRDTCVYARVRGVEEPTAGPSAV